MMKFFKIAFVALFATVLTLMPEAALAVGSTAAQGAGGSVLDDVAGLLSGNIGTVIGLGIAVFGLYMWLVQQESWGIMMIIGGVAITAFPGLFTSMQTSFATATAASGSNANAAEDF